MAFVQNALSDCNPPNVAVVPCNLRKLKNFGGEHGSHREHENRPAGGIEPDHDSEDHGNGTDDQLSPGVALRADGVANAVDCVAETAEKGRLLHVERPEARIHRAKTTDCQCRSPDLSRPGLRNGLADAISVPQGLICLTVANYLTSSSVDFTTALMASLLSSPLLKAWLLVTLPSTHIMTVTSAFGLIL